MNIRNGTKRISATGLLSRASILALGVAVSAPALAQDAEDAAPEQAQRGGVLMQEIVVTANKRQENLQDVGIAATAFSGEALARLGVTNTEALTKVTPALNVNYANPSVSQLSVRGVSQNDFADHLEPPVAVYQDEGYIGTQGGVSFPLFDMQRVEVLRGPQGTLFGRNATGGLIHYVSEAPTDYLTGYAEASYGRFDTWNVQGAISGPITEGVRARVAFTRNKSDGPFFNVVTNQKDVGDTNNWAIRGRLSIDVGPDTTLDLLGSYTNTDQHGPVWPFRVGVPGADGLGVAMDPSDNVYGCTGCNLLGYVDEDGSPWTAASDEPGYFKRDMYHGQAKLTHEFGAVTFTSISDYLEVNKQTFYDTDQSPQQFFHYGADQYYDQFSQELRLNGESDKLKWVGGLYYLNMSGYYEQPLDFDFGLFGGNPLCVGVDCTFEDDATGWTHFEPRYTIDVESWAVFAQGEIELSPVLSLTLGARYTHDKKTNHFEWTGSTDTDPFVADIVYDDAATFENVAAKAQLDWRPADGTLLYASYTRGHKGGNWAAPAPAPFDTNDFPHDQEVLTSYEVGAKQELFGGDGSINVSAYYYDYSDYQAFSLQGIAQAIFNKDAEVYGGEIEFRAAPFNGLEVAANLAWVESKVKDVALPDGSIVDREMPNAAPIQLTGLARYSWDLLGGEMSLQASAKYMDGHYLTVLNEPINYQKSYATVDLRAGWLSPDGSYEISLYADNVTGTYYRIWSLDVSPLSLGMNYPGPRSTYGARVRFNF